jgi:hypothetical protein
MTTLSFENGAGVNTGSSGPLVAAIAPLLMCLCRPGGIAANPIDQLSRDTAADHFLGAENQAEAISLYREFLRNHPANSLSSGVCRNHDL